jgi:PHD/YefM family antitoxin component YafN of YafNO toxin-antitoxin module
MYILYMNSVASTYARQNWAETLELAKLEPVVVTDHGRPAVVMMNPELARLALQVLEDSRDLELATKALERVEAGGKTYSLSEVAAELGIDLDTL